MVATVPVRVVKGVNGFSIDFGWKVFRNATLATEAIAAHENAKWRENLPASVLSVPLFSRRNVKSASTTTVPFFAMFFPSIYR